MEAPGQTLGRAALHRKASRRLLARLGLEEGAVEACLQKLRQENHVTFKERGGGKGSYTLTSAGAAYCGTLPAPATADNLPPLINDRLLPYQKSFMLLQLLKAKDRVLTRGQLNQKLDTALAKGSLGFARLPEGVGEAARLKLDQSTVDWLLERLAADRAITKQNIGQSARYHLTDQGVELFVASDQYPFAGKRLVLTYEEFNAILAAVREAIPRSFGENAQKEPSAPSVGTNDEGKGLTAELVLQELEELQRERFSAGGIVPVYALRRRLCEKYGAEAAGHDLLDPLLKRLRREKRLRLTAIGDRSQATEEQLADAVPGDNETFFYLEALHEHAHVR
jgi:DNA-binding PadR family transcriptional regulator